jgi:hypothetical protein
MGNFEETQPTQAQVDALVNLLTALAKKYNINPDAQERYHQTTSTAPYITSKQLPTIVGHGDIAATACPGEWLHSLMPFIRSEISKRLKGATPSKVLVRGTATSNIVAKNETKPASSSSSASKPSSDFSSRLLKIQETQPELLKAVIQLVRERYKGTLPNATTSMNKLAYKYTLDEIKQWLSGRENVPTYLRVLLYELTTSYPILELSCKSDCVVSFDGASYE